MTNIKYIALDLDGTLTNSKKEITPATKAALIHCQEHGIQLILASGRPTPGLFTEAKALKMDEFGGFLISFNGARIHKYPSMECLKDMTLSVEEGQKLIAQARAFPQYSMMTYSDTHLIVEDIEGYQVRGEAALNNMPIQVIDNMEAYVDHPVNKFLFATPPEKMLELEDQFKAPFPDLSLYCSTPYYLEAMTTGIDKAATLAELIEDVGDTLDHLMAFGDGYNDFKMIQLAGVGVCMGNGDERVKEIADYVSVSNDEDGIVYALKELLPEVME